jgi:hypothetical protein
MMKGAGSVIRPFFDVIAPFVIARNESDEAIHSCFAAMDCFAALAMTERPHAASAFFFGGKRP